MRPAQMFEKEDNMKNILFILIAAALPECGQSPAKFDMESDHDENSEKDTVTDTDMETDQNTDRVDSLGNDTDEPNETDTNTNQFSDSEPAIDTESAEMVETDEDTDSDTETISDTVTDTDTDTEDTVIPDFVCDEWSCPDSQTCDIGEYWVCPLLPEAVFIAAATYKSQWLICVDVDGTQTCPTTDYHRECAQAPIGLSCHV
jgi:hypothetical protein